MAVEGERATITGRKRLDQVRRYYDGQAFIYSLDPVQKYGFRAIRTEVVDSMGLSPGDTAVDMGTGTKGAGRFWCRGGI